MAQRKHEQFQKRKMMGARSEDVDQYIADAPVFARPMLNTIRKAFHFGCPDLEETIKWGAPCFEHEGLLGSMAAFKGHVTATFWKGQLMEDPLELFDERGNRKMASMRFKALKEMPPSQVLTDYVREAVSLNEGGAKAPKMGRADKPALEIPEDFKKAMSSSSASRATFERFSYTDRRDYVEWITEAKRASTRSRRITQAVKWLAEGKPRNWKYQNAKGKRGGS